MTTMASKVVEVQGFLLMMVSPALLIAKER